MAPAPFRADLADAPEGGHIVWRTASDGVRLRLGYWGAASDRGTILLFPGRTEYIEKYGKVIRELRGQGYAVATIDWRGQGLSDRLDEDDRLGHVTDFLDYQLDVETLSAFADEMGLPERRALIAHSMGGCIGLRALTQGLKVHHAVFSAPMWGIQMPAVARPLTYILPPIARMLKTERTYAPGTRPVNYVTETGFETNLLTTDRDTYAWLGKHAASGPEFALGGPSVQWVGAATQETNRLYALPRPVVPTLTFLGSEEAIVSSTAIEKFHANWPGARLRHLEGCKHEVMMEAPPIRQRFFEETFAFLDAA